MVLRWKVSAPQTSIFLFMNYEMGKEGRKKGGGRRMEERERGRRREKREGRRREKREKEGEGGRRREKREGRRKEGRRREKREKEGEEGGEKEGKRKEGERRGRMGKVNNGRKKGSSLTTYLSHFLHVHLGRNHSKPEKFQTYKSIMHIHDQSDCRFKVYT